MWGCVHTIIIIMIFEVWLCVNQAYTLPFLKANKLQNKISALFHASFLVGKKIEKQGARYINK